MQFNRLRLAGFKSFVDATELRIEPGLTGVVGPNGCGKSNLLEAIRWVMGEGSAKSLRGGGMDDVIFAGTAVRPGRDFAEVTLTLDNRARTAPADINSDDTLEVVRRIERGLGSAYRVNGRDVRARDVALLFADNATGAHSPALVSQGRIGAIIAARPAERRALLEEAAGISGLHARRHEAELRLRATEANLARLDDVVAAQAAIAAALRRAAKAAERYRAVTDALTDAAKALLFARWSAAQAAAAAAGAATAKAETQVGDTTRTAARLANEQATAAATLPALRTAEAEAAATLQALTQAQRGLAAEAIAVERRARDLAAAAAAIARDRARESDLAGDAAAARDRLMTEAATLATQVAAADAGWPAAEVAVAVAEYETGKTENRLAAAIEVYAGAAASARAAVIAVDTATARQARAETEAARLAAMPAFDVAALDEIAAVATIARDDAAAAIMAATTDIAAADAKRVRAEGAREAASRDLLAARGITAALTSERDTLTRLLANGGATATLLDRISVVPGDERAVGAAFGDDLLASLDAVSGRHWVATGGAVPPLPAGAVPLGATVPAELARRLAATGVVDPAVAPDIAEALLPGQSLVTRDGRLWRWDGFRDFGGAANGGHAAAAAERLTQRNRLVAISGDLPAAVAVADRAQAAAAVANSALAAAAVGDRDARFRRATAERDHDTAWSALAAATDARDRAAARAETTAAAIRRLRDDVDGFAREAAAARDVAAEVAGLPPLAAAVVTARGEAESARAALASARVTAAALSRDRVAAVARAGQVTTESAAWDRRTAASAAHLADLATRATAAANEATAVAARPAAIAAEAAVMASRATIADRVRAAATDALTIAEAAATTLDRDARAITELLATAREARARAAADADHAAARRREIEAASDAQFAASPPNLGVALPGDPDALAADVTRLTAAREAIGPVNLRADLELAELTATIDATASERAELDTAIARLRGSIGALNREGRVRLLAAFTAVDGHFRELFATLFTGGAAHLALVDADDPLAAGLEIMAQPPGKKLQSLTLLSGGEQALTATALIFALFLTTPSPLCVLDEVDAPLDDANVERFCDLLDRMAADTKTRFLIVTHNAVTMSRMYRLYGVTMAEPGVSQLVSVDLGGAARLLAAE